MIKINQLELENVKRIKAVKLEPTLNGLTIIGGKNGQGKTSVLDAIAWALGGERYRPSQPKRTASVIPPMLHIELSNGLIVERRGKNSDLKITDPNGSKSGQQLLNEFISELALDLPKFINAGSRERAELLLKVIGVGDILAQYDCEESRLYNERHTIGQLADRKEKLVSELPSYPRKETELISITELISRQQEILAKNGENQRLREKRDDIKRQKEDIEAELCELNEKYRKICEEYEVAFKSAENLQDEATEQIERDIAEIEKINLEIRANLNKLKAEEEAAEYRSQYNELTEKIDDIRTKRRALLDNAELPLEGLGIENGELTYRGYKWDNMSGSEQLKAATAIVRKLNPNCGFVLLDRLEQMDTDTLTEFGEWLEGEGLQAIATRVSVGDECSVIIEDGQLAENDEASVWQKGVF